MAGIVAVRSLASRNCVVKASLPNSIVELFTKFEPLTVSVNCPLPGTTPAGESETIDGTGVASLGPTIVVGLVGATDKPTLVSPLKSICIVDGHPGFVPDVAQFGELFDVTKSIRLSPPEMLVVPEVLVRAIVKVMDSGAFTICVTMASRQES